MIIRKDYIRLKINIIKIIIIKVEYIFIYSTFYFLIIIFKK